MADDKTATPGAGAAPSADNAPRATIINQYIKDLSFENPNAFEAFKGTPGQAPKIEVSIDINGIKKDNETYEAELKFTITAKQGETNAFVIELVYAGLFAVVNMPEEAVQPFMHVQAPFILFPFARRIIADATRDGGYPPLMLDPIDFTGLYQARMQADAGKGATANA